VKSDYDETETPWIVLKDTPVRESEEERFGVILDYDATGQLDNPDASTRVDTVDGVQLKVRKAGRRGAIAVLLALRSTMPSVDPLSHGPAFPPPASSSLRSRCDSG
jgi:hypothetical protein